MEQESLIQQFSFRICRWCEKRHYSADSFCSDQCRTNFYNWVETEHAAIRGKRPMYWNIIRRNALIRGGNRCYICHDDKNLSVHHIIPLAEGGDSTAENLRVLCHNCHSKIHGRRGHKNGRKKKFRIRIRYQPLYLPAILACNWFWDERNELNQNFLLKEEH